MDYKDTLLLPQTRFEMRGDLAKKEPLRYAAWRQKRVYDKMLALRKDAQNCFNIHDGPPYANGHIHIGHALNKILKDIITKTHYFFGDSVRYVPGWDCHGLPIEQQVDAKLADAKKSLTKAQIREHCRNWAEEFIAIQRGEFEQLGVVGDFDNPYKTLKPRFEAAIYRTLCDVARRGLLVERSKPVFWSWAARSALAEAEIEYEDKEDYSLYIAFDMSAAACERLGIAAAKAVIWTTMSWTLPANQGISLNPHEKYALTAEGYIIAAPLLENCVKVGFTKGEVVREFAASELEGLYAINPLNDRPSLLMLGEHVLMDGGTGLVHTAPGHGEDDYFVSLRYGLETLMPVGEDGCFDAQIRALVPREYADELEGMHVFGANDRLLDILRERGGSLLSVSRFTHSFPFCWRTHKPVIYRATKQWFIAMDEPVLDGGKTLREVALGEIERVKFYPPSGRNRLASMVANRPDWCISRQRDWGVPIAFFREKSSGKLLLDDAVLDNVARIFDERGADAWWEMSVAELLPAQFAARAGEFEKCAGILDVWFDSGSTWNAVLQSGEYDAGALPASMYLEGSDQHRGWFQSSLLISCAVSGRAPFDSVVTHGFTMDKNGNKMSKSRGNVVAPQEVAKKFGVEILRLWVATSDYTNEQKIGDEILKQVAEQYRKIRNTIRFMLASVGDLGDKNPADLAKFEFSGLDAWILSRAKAVFDEAHAAFGAYEFSRGYQSLLAFLGGDLSGIYLDICKDRLYCERADAPVRTASQRAIALILRSLLGLIAPVLTYTADEALEAAPDVVRGGAGDVFELLYSPLEFAVKPGGAWGDDVAAELVALRGQFNEAIDALKKDKVIKNTLELRVVGDFGALAGEVAEWFVASNAQSAHAAGTAGFSGGDFGGGDFGGRFDDGEVGDKVVFAGENLSGFAGGGGAGANSNLSGGAGASGDFGGGNLNGAGAGAVLASFKSAVFGRVSFVRSPFCKCPRCWKFNAASEDALCERCAGVLG